MGTPTPDKESVNTELDKAIKAELRRIMYGTYTDAQAEAVAARIKELMKLKNQ